MSIAESLAEWVALNEPDGPPVPPAPRSVFVALCVYTKAVLVQQAAATTPLSGGRMAIFNRPQATTEERLGVDILAVTDNRYDADQAVHVHASVHPDLKCEYTVELKEVGFQSALEEAHGPTTHPCLGCGNVQLTGNVARCQPCQQKHWANGGWVPSGKGEE